MAVNYTEQDVAVFVFTQTTGHFYTMPTILITGGTGLIGQTLTNTLVEKGYRVIILTRDLSGKNEGNNISYALWDIKKQWIDMEAIGSADHIIHLAGASVMEKKWTAAYKKEIIDSR